VAVSCSRLLVGDHPDFAVSPQEPAGLPMIVLFLVFGLLTGVVGVAYNTLVTGALTAADRLDRVPPTARAAVLGAMVGLALYVSPFTVGASPIPFALVGMAAFFAATVRAPFTGIVLVVEMTAIATVTVPMLAACFAATLTATLLRNPPVYDSLRDRMLGRHD
jgi:CIC family chloride channel protein